MKLKDINFNEVKGFGLAIQDNGKIVSEGFIGDVLNECVHLADREVKETRYYFDEFVVELESEVGGDEKI